jgi:hypothetical protein
LISSAAGFAVHCKADGGYDGGAVTGGSVGATADGGGGGDAATGVETSGCATAVGGVRIGARFGARFGFVAVRADGCGFVAGVRGGATDRTADELSSRVEATAIAIPPAKTTPTSVPTRRARERRRGGEVSGTTTMSSPSKGAFVTGSATECSGPPVVVTSSPWRPPPT